jgi:CRISPR-associated protein Cmr2
MLATLLAYQLDRQAKGDARHQAPDLASRLAKLCAAQERKGLSWLANFMGVAEFLARETRNAQSTFATEDNTQPNMEATA